MARKLRVGVVFGGRSGEHEVSLKSAASVVQYLDPNKYEVIPIAIDRAGTWLLGIDPLQWQQIDATPAPSTAPVVSLTTDPHLHGLIPTRDASSSLAPTALDIIFPVLHGPYGEDGTIQGLFEMANIPYVGCGVLGSAVGMDKEIMKALFRSANLPIIETLAFLGSLWERDPDHVFGVVEQRLGYPCFVKPANLGSSVGVNKARNRAQLTSALALAAEYDRKIIIEQGIVDCREISCAVMGNDEPLVSVVGEIITGPEFTDYNHKYINRTISFEIPAHISDEDVQFLRTMALTAYRTLDLNGLARVDFFLDGKTNQYYINEVNTLPGFTEMSLYPKLWAASGVEYTQLLDRLIEFALQRYRERQGMRVTL
jgi:D-alanine-D-alanine ligase